MAIIETVIRWADNTAELAQNLKSGLDQIEAMKSSVDRLTKSMGGDGLFRSANNLVAAIDQLGGVTKLTGAEQDRANALLDKAIEKYTAMGLQAPSAMLALRDATERSGGAASSATALFTSFSVAVGTLLHDAVIAAIGKLEELAGFFPTLAIQGSVVDDVTQAFDRLTAQAGLTASTLLSSLRTATHGTIDDFTLMQRVNQDLAAGLKLSDDQFGLLAQGAFALAKATGTDVKTALDSMSDAMVTGRAKGVAMLTGKIDLKVAEENFRQSLTDSNETLTAEGKLQADRVAILAAVQSALGRVGTQQDSLKDKVDQAKASWTNLQNSLGQAIATSPVLATGLDGIRDALVRAFGGSQKDLITAIGHAIDEAAIAVVSFAQTGVTVGGDLVKEYYAVQKVFGDLAQIVSGDALAFEYLSLGMAKVAGSAADVERINDNINSLLLSMKARGDALQEDSKNQAAVDATTAGYVTTLQALHDRMVAAIDDEGKLAASSADAAAKKKAEADATVAVDAYLQQSAKTKAEIQAQADKLDTDYTTARLIRSGTASQTEIANINKTYQDLWDALTKSGALSDEVAAKLDRNWGDALGAVGVDWKALRDDSINALQDTYDRAQKTFLAMQADGLLHSAAQIQYFRNLRDVAFEALHDIAGEHQAEFQQMMADVDTTSDHYRDWLANVATDADKAALELKRMQAQTQLNQQAADAAAVAYTTMMEAGGSMTYDLSTEAGIQQYEKLNPAATLTWSDQQIMDFVKAGGTLQTLISSGVINPYGGYNQGAQSVGSAQIAGFASGVDNFSGGLALVGEQGPELVSLPGGASVTPNGMGGGDTYVVNVKGVFGTIAQVRQAVSQAMFAASGRKVTR